MPHQESSHRNEKALLWEATGAFDNYGQPVVGDVEEIDVKWQWSKIGPRQPMIGTRTIDAIAHVGQAIREGSHMVLSDEEEWMAGSGVSDNDVLEVVAYREAADVKSRGIRRLVMLAKFKDKP